MRDLRGIAILFDCATHIARARRHDDAAAKKKSLLFSAKKAPCAGSKKKNGREWRAGRIGGRWGVVWWTRTPILGAWGGGVGSVSLKGSIVDGFVML